MVNRRFRSPATPLRVLSHSTLSAIVRASLSFALALTLLPAAAPNSFKARAQTSDANANNSIAIAKRGERNPAGAKGRGFILYSADGGASCRVAPEEEIQRYIQRGKRSGLIQINHLDDKSQANADSSGGAQAEAVQTNLRIILRATPQLDANPTAKAAFIRAAQRWEQVIVSPITIVIDVDFGTTAFNEAFDPGVIGVTLGREDYHEGGYQNLRQHLRFSPSSVQEQTVYAALPDGASVPTDLASGPVSDTFVSSPILRALGQLGAHADPVAEDPYFTDSSVPKIGFNSNFNFDFDPDNGNGNTTCPGNGIDCTRLDFDGIATHEIGHVLGFVSWSGLSEMSSSGGQNFDPAMNSWDLFRFHNDNPSAVNLGNFKTHPRSLRSDVGLHFEFNGHDTRHGLATGRPNGEGGDGDQGSHWRDASPSGAIGIMDPAIANGERSQIKTSDLRALDAMGFRVNVDGGPQLAAPPPPAHDNLASAKTLFGGSGSDSFSNRFATKEAFEPTLTFPSTQGPYSTPAVKSTWYKWTANANGQATINTAGSSFDTTLSVYVVNNTGSFTLVALNDDVTLGNNVTSSIQFNAEAGKTYYVSVDGFIGNAGGDVVFNWQLPGTPPPANTVQFSPSNPTTVSEGTTKIDLTVTRSGDLSGAASVNYATSDGTARDEEDYLASLGTINFAPHVASAIISVFIIDDAYGDGSENFQLALSNPVGCTLGAPSSATITISDNAENGLNPVRNNTNGTPSFNAQFFVGQQYVDFFNREADTPGLNFWVGNLGPCTPGDAACLEPKKINVSAAFFLSIEFQRTGFFVYRAYSAAFGPRIGGRVPLTLREFLPDTQQIGRGVVIGQPGADEQIEQNRQAFVNEFVQRPQFISLYPLWLTPTQYVDALNANTGGSLSQGERDNLINQLNAGNMTRAQVLRAVAEDTDFNAREKNKAFVLMQYFGYLRRNPYDAPEPTLDFTGYDFWLNKLNQFGGDAVAAQMIEAFIGSEEYKRRFGQ